MDTECPICLTEFDINLKISWAECPHSLCRDCFVKSAVIYSFENNATKIECPLCRTDVNKITQGAESISVDMWTKFLRFKN